VRHFRFKTSFENFDSRLNGVSCAIGATVPHSSKNTATMSDHKIENLQTLFQASENVQKAFPKFSFCVDDDRMFNEALEHGYLDAAKWIKEHRRNATTTIPVCWNFPIICGHGHLDVIQWLYQQGLQPTQPIAISSGIDAAEKWGHYHVAQWLNQNGYHYAFQPVQTPFDMFRRAEEMTDRKTREIRLQAQASKEQNQALKAGHPDGHIHIWWNNLPAGVEPSDYVKTSKEFVADSPLNIQDLYVGAVNEGATFEWKELVMLPVWGAPPEGLHEVHPHCGSVFVTLAKVEAWLKQKLQSLEFQEAYVNKICKIVCGQAIRETQNLWVSLALHYNGCLKTLMQVRRFRENQEENSMSKAASS